MKRTITIIAKVVSILCHPLWMASYGVTLYTLSNAAVSSPELSSDRWTFLLFTLLLTAFLPICTILILRAKGKISSFYIDLPSERTTPYLITAGLYAVWWAGMIAMFHAPLALIYAGQGSVLALIFVAIINKHWKISAHLTGLGGLIGGVITFSLTTGMGSISLLIALLLITAVLMNARVLLQAHSPLQVVAGFFLGMACTCSLTLIHTYV